MIIEQDKTNLTLGRAIRILRNARDMTGKRCAKASTISASYLSLIESGERIPHIDTAKLIAKALGVSYDVFIIVMSPTMMGVSKQADDVYEAILSVASEEDRLRQLLASITASLTDEAIAAAALAMDLRQG